MYLRGIYNNPSLSREQKLRHFCMALRLRIPIGESFLKKIFKEEPTFFTTEFYYDFDNPDGSKTTLFAEIFYLFKNNEFAKKMNKFFIKNKIKIKKKDLSPLYREVFFKINIDSFWIKFLDYFFKKEVLNDPEIINFCEGEDFFKYLKKIKYSHLNNSFIWSYEKNINYFNSGLPLGEKFLAGFVRSLNYMDQESVDEKKVDLILKKIVCSDLYKKSLEYVDLVNIDALIIDGFLVKTFERIRKDWKTVNSSVGIKNNPDIYFPKGVFSSTSKAIIEAGFNVSNIFSDEFVKNEVQGNLFSIINGYKVYYPSVKVRKFFGLRELFSNLPDALIYTHPLMERSFWINDLHRLYDKLAPYYKNEVLINLLDFQEEDSDIKDKLLFDKSRDTYHEYEMIWPKNPSSFEDLKNALLISKEAKRVSFSNSNLAILIKIKNRYSEKNIPTDIDQISRECVNWGLTLEAYKMVVVEMKRGSFLEVLPDNLLLKRGGDILWSKYPLGQEGLSV